MSAHVHTETDMRPFENALDEDFCHFFGPEPGVALCGTQYVSNGAHSGTHNTERCDGCGRLNCPSCQHAAGVRRA